MSFLKKIKQLFKKEEEQLDFERNVRELLRENLNTVAVDVFTIDDPLFALNPAERREYLLYFNRLVVDKKLIDRIKYLINKQAQMSLKYSKNEKLDMAGALTMNGLGLVKDEVELFSKMFTQEEEDLKRQRNPLSASESLRL